MMKAPVKQFLMTWNSQFWNLCRYYSSRGPICFTKQYFDAVCARLPARITKLTRLPFSAMGPLLAKAPFEAGSTKVVFLFRDPRAVMNSRADLDWCREPKCSDAATVCKDMSKDLKVL